MKFNLKKINLKRFNLKRFTLLLMTSVLCASAAACGKNTADKEQKPDKEAEASINTENTSQIPRLVGGWQLDDKRNDLADFEDSLELFPGYGEWGAFMELKNNGEISWYIGAEGGHGSYTVEGNRVQAQIISDLEQTEQSLELRILDEKDGVTLEMPYKDMKIYWTYGNREDKANGDNE